MPNWQEEITDIAKAFKISKYIYLPIINATAHISTAQMPMYYHGNIDDYYYDTAYRKLKKFIFN